MKNQYNTKLSGKYTNLVKTDPAKMFVQYPEALRLLDDVEGKRILDIGCGSGDFDVLLQRQGAVVTGYDKSPQQIEAAKKICEEGNFFVGSPKTVSFSNAFDKAVSVLVLHYSRNIKELQMFFFSTFQALKPGGKFICILTNPNFKRYGIVRYNRRYVLLGDEIRADFINRKGEIDFSVNYLHFSKNDYEITALQAGFRLIEWHKLEVNPAGVDEMGEEYWQGFQDDCPYVGFIAYK